MIRMTDSVCVDAPVVSVWTALSELEAIQHWSPTIQRSRCVSDHARGVDAVRACELAGNVTVTETMTDWQEGESFTNVSVGIPLVKWARNRWSVEAQGMRTLVTTTSEVEFRGGAMGRLLEPIMRHMSRRMGEASLASFKFLVEQGTPYDGDAKKLLPIPAGC
jgi:hypothetical protein